MSVYSALASFAVIAGLMTMVPGLDTALVVRTAVVAGRRAGFATAVGISTGVLAWSVAAAVGVSALLAASRLAYDGVRLAGAVYLAWLGLSLLWRSWCGEGRAGRRSLLACWWRGTATNLLNPKIGVFYVAMLPQFIPAGAPHLLMGVLLGLVHDAEGIAWFTLLITAAHLARGWLASVRAHRVMDRVTGTVLIGFGVKLALSRQLRAVPLARVAGVSGGPGRGPGCAIAPWGGRAHWRGPGRRRGRRPRRSARLRGGRSLPRPPRPPVRRPGGR